MRKVPSGSLKIREEGCPRIVNTTSVYPFLLILRMSPFSDTQYTSLSTTMGELSLLLYLIMARHYSKCSTWYLFDMCFWYWLKSYKLHKVEKSWLKCLAGRRWEEVDSLAFGHGRRTWVYALIGIDWIDHALGKASIRWRVWLIEYDIIVSGCQNLYLLNWWPIYRSLLHVALVHDRSGRVAREGELIAWVDYLSVRVVQVVHIAQIVHVVYIKSLLVLSR